MANFDRYKEKDKELFEAVAKLKAGNTDSLNSVYELSKRYIYKIILDIVKRPEDAEDLMQETYIQIFNNIGSLQESQAFYVWAGRIATNKTLRYIQKNSHEVLATADEDGSTDFVFEQASDDKEEFIPESILMEREKQRLIADILDSLSVEQKLSVQYFYYEEMSVHDIAEQMECSEGTVKSRLNYARQSIKRAVVDLDKKHGTRLYSLASVPLFYIIFREFIEDAILGTVVGAGTVTAGAVASAGTTASGTAAGTAVGTGAAAAGTATVTSESGVAATAGTAGKAAAGTAGKAAAGTVGKATAEAAGKMAAGTVGKVATGTAGRVAVGTGVKGFLGTAVGKTVAIATAVTVVAGGTTAGIVISNNNKQQYLQQESQQQSQNIYYDVDNNTLTDEGEKLCEAVEVICDVGTYWRDSSGMFIWIPGETRVSYAQDWSQVLDLYFEYLYPYEDAVADSGYNMDYQGIGAIYYLGDGYGKAAEMYSTYCGETDGCNKIGLPSDMEFDEYLNVIECDRFKTEVGEDGMICHEICLDNPGYYFNFYWQPDLTIYYNSTTDPDYRLSEATQACLYTDKYGCEYAEHEDIDPIVEEILAEGL